MAEELRFDVHAWDDPNGPALATLESVLVGTKKIDKEFLGRGSGNFAIRRDSAEFTSEIIARNNIVKAYYLPYSSATPYFAFRLKTGDFTAISKRGPSGEVFEFGGPGLREYLSDARLYPEHFTGSSALATPSDGKWHWTDDQYGDIFLRLLLEAAARTGGSPIPHITYTWTSTQDTAGNAWPSFAGEFALDIGVNYETAVETMENLGDLFVRVTPDLVFQAYVNSWGIDRSSATFASGKVRFAKGVNIFNDVEKVLWGEQRATHVIVGGANYTFVTVVDPDYVLGDERVEKFIAYGETDDEAALAKVGQKAIREGKKAQDAILLEVRVGNTPLSGLYRPGTHYDVGDILTLHSGSGAHNYNNSAHELRSVGLIEGPTGAVRVVLELNGDAVGTGDEPGGMFTPDDDCCGGPGSQHGPGGATGRSEENAPLVSVERSISGGTDDGIGSYDGVLFASWDTGNSSIYHSDAQPKAGTRHHINIESVCYPLYDAYDGVHQMMAGSKFHFGGSGGDFVGVARLTLALTASHGTGWPNTHPRFGPYAIHMYKYLGASTAVDAPAEAALVGTPIAGWPDIGPSTNADPKQHLLDIDVDLSDVPYDGTTNVIFVIVPLWEVGGYTCLGSLDPEGGFGEISGDTLTDFRIPQGPGWYNGPVGGAEKDGVQTVFTVPYGYDEVREVTVNGIELPPSAWVATDGTTIEFIGFAPKASDDIYVKRYIPQ